MFSSAASARKSKRHFADDYGKDGSLLAFFSNGCAMPMIVMEQLQCGQVPSAKTQLRSHMMHMHDYAPEHTQSIWPPYDKVD